MRLATVLLLTLFLGMSSRLASAAEDSHDHSQHVADGAADTPALDAATSMVRRPAGTAWQPDETPHAATHLRLGEWTVAGHYLLFGGYDAQEGRRGDDEVIGTGWGMLMAERRFEKTFLGARLMMSPEPFTTGDDGYPLLLQTGEMLNGERLHDRQHPHDLFMEMAATAALELRPGWALELYGGPVGDPALGPVAAPHRHSASSDPFAAIGHHWLDATHVTFGVMTAGLVTPVAKIEASWFNGREPDDDRYDFDLRAPDSWSTRISVNPTRRLSLQVSYGSIESHDALEPEEELQRVTTSAMYHRTIGAGHWATTFAYGRNIGDHAGNTNAFLLETNLDLDGTNVLFGRAEIVEKTDHDLVLGDELHGSTFTVTSLALGFLRKLGQWHGVEAGIGVRGAIHALPGRLERFYGSRYPVGGMAFARIAPAG